MSASASASARSSSISIPTAAGRSALAAKLARLALLKPDDLAILFDDMRGDVPDLAERQAAIVHYAAERSGAARILCCPSYYSDDPILDVAFGQRPPFYLEQLGRLLDPAIRIFWTGAEVCAGEYSPGHLARVAGQLGRKPMLWDNYPVNDGARMSQHLHLRAFTGRPAAIAPLIAGHGINPASQPLLSRIPALTLAESYAEGDAYDYRRRLRARRAGGAGRGARRRASAGTCSRCRIAASTGSASAAPTLRARYAAFDHPGGAGNLCLARRLLERHRRTGANAIITDSQ